MEWCLLLSEIESSVGCKPREVAAIYSAGPAVAVCKGYTGSFGVAKIPAGYVPKNQNLKKLSGGHLEKGLKCVQKENGSQKSHKQCMKRTSLIQQKSLIYSFLPLYCMCSLHTCTTTMHSNLVQL